MINIPDLHWRVFRDNSEEVGKFSDIRVVTDRSLSQGLGIEHVGLMDVGTFKLVKFI